MITPSILVGRLFLEGYFISRYSLDAFWQNGIMIQIPFVMDYFSNKHLIQSLALHFLLNESYFFCGLTNLGLL
jgi:hypothetical protein